MSVIGLIWGIIAFFWMGIALIPLLGWMNWLNIPFAAIGLIISIFGFMRRGNPAGMAGIILNSIAIIVGILRLVLGGGFI